LVGKPEGNRQHERRMNRWENDIRMGFRGTRRKGVVWIKLNLDRDQWRSVVNTVMNLRVL
jgi:hypothetical protein